MDSNFGGAIVFSLSEVKPFLSKDIHDFVINFSKRNFLSEKEFAVLTKQASKLEPKFAEQIGKALLTKMGYHAFAS